MFQERFASPKQCPVIMHRTSLVKVWGVCLTPEKSCVTTPHPLIPGARALQRSTLEGHGSQSMSRTGRPWFRVLRQKFTPEECPGHFFKKLASSVAWRGVAAAQATCTIRI